MADNGGAYQLWLDKTSLTQATYAGERGHQYAFYSVATDQAGNPETAPAQADLTVTVAANAALADLAAPNIASSSLPANGVYGLNANLDFAVRFNESVFVDIATTPPKIALTIGAAAASAQYVSGSGTNTLVFRHVVASGEYDADGVALGNAIQLNGGSIRDTTGNPVANLALTVGSTAGIKVDNAPTVANPLADQVVLEEHVFSFTVPVAAFADANAGDTLVYTATKAGGSALPAWLGFNATTRLFIGTPGNGDVGNVDVKVKATDSLGASVTDTFKLSVTNVNDAPAGADKSVNVAGNTAYTLQTADFGFADPNDNPKNSLSAVKISTLPAAGLLKLNGVNVVAGALVSVTDIAAGKLSLLPSSAATVSFTFQVKDNGGTANGGVDLDPSANTFTAVFNNFTFGTAQNDNLLGGPNNDWLNGGSIWVSGSF